MSLRWGLSRSTLYLHKQVIRPTTCIDIFLCQCICGLFIFIVWQRQVCRSYETSAWHQSTTCAVRGTNSPRTKEQRFACIVNGIRDRTDRICVCVCVSVLVCFQTFFGTRRFILLNEYCPPSLAFQKDLACFCCLLYWHHLRRGDESQPLAGFFFLFCKLSCSEPQRALLSVELRIRIFFSICLPLCS